jgi:hypothetical protein
MYMSEDFKKVIEWLNDNATGPHVANEALDDFRDGDEKCEYYMGCADVHFQPVLFLLQMAGNRICGCQYRDADKLLMKAVAVFKEQQGTFKGIDMGDYETC